MDLSGFAPYFVAGFVALWVVVSILMSHLSGWRRLAQHYPAAATPEGRSLWVGLVLRWVAYRGIVRLKTGHSHLHFSVALPWRIAHPPFSVPWGDISGVPDRYWGFPAVRFTIARAPDIDVRMSASDARRLAAASGGCLHLVDAGPAVERSPDQKVTSLPAGARHQSPWPRFALGCLAAVGIATIVGTGACAALIGFVVLLPNSEEGKASASSGPRLQQAQVTQPQDLELPRRETPSMDSLAGVWQFYRWRLCKPVVALTTPISVAVEELEIRGDGTFLLTWSRRGLDGALDASATGRDYGGRYILDAASRSISLQIETGPVPQDFDGTGEVFLDADGLTVKDVWLGSPPGQPKPDICELTFRRK
jgi:hypothetical protein